MTPPWAARLDAPRRKSCEPINRKTHTQPGTFSSVPRFTQAQAGRAAPIKSGVKPPHSKSESFPPGEGVAECHAGSVGFVDGQGAAVSQQRHYGARHLFLAGATGADHRLLHAQGRVFEDR